MKLLLVSAGILNLGCCMTILNIERIKIEKRLFCMVCKYCGWSHACGDYYSRFFKAMTVTGCKLDHNDEICIGILRDTLSVTDYVGEGGFGCAIPLEWFESDNYEEVIKRDFNHWLDENKVRFEKERQKKLEAEKKKRDREYAEYLKLKKKFEP